MNISEDRYQHLVERSKSLTAAESRIAELEAFLVAEGDLHYSHREFEKMEAKVEQAQKLEREAFGAGLLAATNHFIKAFENANNIDPQQAWIDYRGESAVDHDGQK